MKIVLSGFIVFIAIIVACHKETNTQTNCNVENPLEELPWLKELKSSLTNCTCQASIFEGRYKGGTIFFTMVNDPLCNTIFGVALFDCAGKVVKTYDYEGFDEYVNEVTEVKQIYTCTQ